MARRARRTRAGRRGHPAGRDDVKAITHGRQRVLFWLGWWVVLWALYVVLVFKTEPAEIVAGAVAAAFAATGAELVRHHGSVRFMARWSWLRGLLPLPREIVVETAQLVPIVVRALVRREPVSGEYRAVEFAGAHARGPHASGRRAMAKWVGSVAPNSLVIGFAEDEDVVLLHQLVRTPRPPNCDPARR